MILLFIFGLIAGMVVPIQTSINSRLSYYTKSSFYASTISFSPEHFLVVLNLIFNPQLLHIIHTQQTSFNYTWFVGGFTWRLFSNR